ncbi:MAG: hypothetical protein IJS26_00760 [Alphaproteobacteria bacterium]|nr:hypothetical protein [Alphaproteobacteria bacterium]
MYKYLNLALIFGVSLFVATAQAAGVIPVPTPHSTGLTYPENTSYMLFRIPQTDGTTKQYYYNYTYPYGSTSSSRIVSATSNILNQHFASQRATGGGSSGGAIFVSRSATIDITASFVSNFATNWSGSGGSYYDTDMSGGAIYNIGTINNLTGYFYSNRAYDYSSSGTNDFLGGAIYSRGNIGTITADFIFNQAIAKEGQANGGAIALWGDLTIGSITGNFIKNEASGNAGDSSGGAIYSRQANIGTITGDFIQNSANGSGGALWLIRSSVTSITGNFLGNTAFENEDVDIGSGGAIHLYDDVIVGTITGSFYGNSSAYKGGAIYNSGTITSITGDFMNNTSEYGGAIDNGGTITSITGDFTNNTSEYGGAISNDIGTIGHLTGNFIGNTATGDDDDNAIWAAASGGAIHNEGTISLYADTQNITFYNNRSGTASGANYYNDIANGYSDWSRGILNLNASTGKSISFGGTIMGIPYRTYYYNGTLNLNNDSSADNRGGQYIFNNTVSGNRFNLYNFGQFC